MYRLLLILVLFIPCLSRAQASVDSIYNHPDHMAEPGFDLPGWIISNIHYPDSSQVPGRVLLGFVVNADGSVCDLKILSKHSSAVEQELVRAFKTIPHWKPAINRGKPVRAYYKLPIILCALH